MRIHIRDLKIRKVVVRRLHHARSKTTKAFLQTLFCNFANIVLHFCNIVLQTLFCIFANIVLHFCKHCFAFLFACLQTLFSIFANNVLDFELFWKQCSKSIEKTSFFSLDLPAPEVVTFVLRLFGFCCIWFSFVLHFLHWIQLFKTLLVPLIAT